MTEAASTPNPYGALDELVSNFGDDPRENARAWAAWAMTDPIPGLVACGQHYAVRHALTRACDVPGVKSSAERFRRDFARAVIERQREQAAEEFADDWGDDPNAIEGMTYDGKGNVKPNVSNAVAAFRRHARWKAADGTSLIRWNEFARSVEIDGARLTDTGATRAQMWAIDELGADFGPDRTSQALAVVAEESPYHPVRDYLNGLTWDGTERVHRLLADYFLSADTQYAATIGARFLVGAVARAMQPGCKHRSVLVLVGAQNKGKSRAVKALCAIEDWFGDNRIDLDNKDAYLALNGKWIFELQEVDHYTAWHSASVLKAFVSQTTDEYRPPYGRHTIRVPRTTVFVGTTNEEEFLTDSTGSTRFWPIRVSTPNVDAIIRDRDQLWAEAVELYKIGTRWHLDEDEEAARREVAATMEVEDPGAARVAFWIRGQPDGFTTEDAMRGAWDLQSAVKANSGEGKRMSGILRKLGLEKRTEAAGSPDRTPRWYRTRGDK